MHPRRNRTTFAYDDRGNVIRTGDEISMGPLLDRFSQSTTLDSPPPFAQHGTAANINGDEFSDLLFYANTELQTWFGTADGQYMEGPSTVIEQSIDIAVADFNDDDHIDLVVSRSDSNTSKWPVQIYLGDGTGNFTVDSTPLERDAVWGSDSELQTVDVDADGDMDVLVAHTSRSTNISEYKTLLNDGNGVFSVVHTSITGGRLGLIHAVDDFDSDGNVDFLHTSGEGSSAFDFIQIAYGLGNGTFTQVIGDGRENSVDILIPSTEVELADVDSDGDQDIVVLSPGTAINAISVITNRGDGTFEPVVRLTLGNSVLGAMDTADIDDDGDVDVIFQDQRAQELRFALNDGSGIFEIAGEFPVSMTESNPGFVVVTDIQNDGLPDIVVGNNNVNVFTNTPPSGPRYFTYENTFNQITSTTDELGRPTVFDVDPINGNVRSVSRRLTPLLPAPVAGLFEVVAPTVSDGLIGYWPFDGGGDDLTANERSLDVPESLGFEAGILGSAVSAANQEYASRLVSDDALGVVASDYTFQIWIKSEPGEQLAGLLGGKHLGGSVNGYFISLTNDGSDSTAHFYTSDPNPTHNADSTTAVNDGQWHQIVGVYDADGNASIYVDGQLEDSKPAGVMIANANPFVVGGVPALIDEVALWDRALSAAEILNIHTQFTAAANGPTPPTRQLTTSLTYTADGLVDTITDPLGRITDNDYDAFGRLITRTLAVGTAEEASQTFEYDAAGNISATIDENGNRTVLEYDPLNRLIRLTEADPDGAGPLTSPITEFDYDANGNLIRLNDPRNNVTQNDYDVLDRLFMSVDPNNGTTQFDYDSVGNLNSILDPLGNQTQNIYDARDRLIETIDPDGGRTRFDYDADNNLTSLVDPVDNETRFEYDARNRQIREIDPLGKPIEYTYDAVNNLVAKTDRNNRVTRFEYDDLDRLRNESWINADTSLANTITYDYDDVSNLLQTTDDFSSLTFTYDNRDRVLTVDNLGTPDVPNVVLTYTYDAVGNVLSVSDAIDSVAAGITTYQYDALNRNIQVAQSGTGVSEKRVDFAYNPLGQFASIDRFSDVAGTQNVVTTTYTYDALNRLQDLRHNNGTDDIAFYEYRYDASSRITQIIDVDGTTHHSYDDRSQLTAANHSDAANPDETYEYDANGNRISSQLHGSGYVTGPGNRLLSDGTYNYEYDDEGSMILRTEIATGDYREFTYDHRNRLVHVVDKNAADVEQQRVEFTYDMLGRRISKTVDGAVTHFVYDQEDVVLDFNDADGSGGTVPALDRRYLHGPGIDQVLAHEDAAVQTIWYLTDHLGTTKDLVDDNGAVVNHIRYGSFGTIVSQTNSLSATRYLFTGREFDEELSLYFYRARHYAPVTGRFVVEDPIGFGGGNANLYGYVANSPLKHLDPTGLRVCFLGSPTGLGLDFHRWIEIGNDASRTYGAYPQGFPYFQPSSVLSPDNNRTGSENEECIDTTPPQERKIEQYIKDNYNVNNDASSNIRNPTYNFGISDCRHFVNDVKRQLEKIIVRGGGNAAGRSRN